MINPNAPLQSSLPLQRPASAGPAAAPQAPADGFKTADASDLRSLMEANSWAQARSSPSGKAKAISQDHVLRVTDKQGQQVSVFQGDPVSFQWLDNDRLLVQGDGAGDERSRLFVVRSDGSQSTPLCADPKAEQSLCWRSGSSLFYRSNERNGQDFDLMCHDFKTGQTRPVCQGQGAMDFELQTADGKVVASRDDKNTENSLWLIDPATGQSRELLSGARNRPLRMLGDHELLCLSNQGREYIAPAVLDLQTGKLRWLADTRQDTDQVAFSPDGGKIACAVNDDGYSKLALFDAQGQPLPSPELPKGVVSQFSFKDPDTLRFSFSAPDTPGSTAELKLSTGEVRLIKDGHLEGLVKPELVHYQSGDGTTLSGFLYLPKGHQPGQPMPAVMQFHGGPDSQTRPRFDPVVQHLLDKGVAVLTPNVRGSTGSGKTFLDADNGALRDGAIQDVKYSAEYLKKIGVDPNRIALMGASAGGYLALAALTMLPEEKWAAVAEQAAPSNLQTLLKPGDLYTDEFGTDPIMQAHLSPVNRAAQAQAPVLIIHGQNDTQVDPGQSQEMLKALQAQGKQVEFRSLPQEGHLIRDLDTRIETNGYIADFLAQHLR